VQPIVECVPNFSEGRRMDVVEAIASAIRATPGATLLDKSSDADHNRTVLTLIGEPGGVEVAAFEAIKIASQLIDLNQHSGEHPRIGATDVVPFIPIRGASMADCVEIAKRLGQRVGTELHIPVYLYEQAATNPDRQNLENIRRGEFEGLKEAIRTDPLRKPDFGPSELGSAGATVIGARAPLVAYNVYLNTDNVEAANRIAKALRHSSGGLRFVKALGLLVNGRAQISMNLTDFTKTPLHRVQEIVRVEAARYGYQIATSELVGLIPEQALIDTARWYLQLDLFDEGQILERKMQTMDTRQQTLPTAFLDSVASSEPTPGGGSVAALAGALASALAGMVARGTMAKKKYAEVEGEMRESATQSDQLRQSLTAAISEDSESFERVMAAFRLPKEEPSRPERIQTATKEASDVPLETARLSLEAMKCLSPVAAKGNINAVTDAAAGVQMALAAIEIAVLNVLINLKGLDDKTVGDAMRAEALRLRDEARSFSAEIMTVVETRMENL
jgi:glutamate formiminotransferase / formiminotetrahydrofolate cyclodeaminase